MRLNAAGKNAILVLLDAKAASSRVLDAMNIRRFLTGEKPEAVAAHTVGHRRRHHHIAKTTDEA
jgi:D-alanyl-D-alanine carboxypeptidase/D-alanyl-D-alanine endopeptidase (penicillin-binding protein 7)